MTDPVGPGPARCAGPGRCVVAVISVAWLLAGCGAAVSPAPSPSQGTASTAASPTVGSPAVPSAAVSVAPSPSAFAIATGGQVPGIDWARGLVPLPAPADSVATVKDVVAGGPGWVAVGGTGGPGAPSRAAIWTSPDGVRWTAVADLPEAEGVVPAAVGTDGRRLVAAGGTPCCADVQWVAVWTSDDGGRTWARAPDTPSLLACRPGCGVSGDGIHALAHGVAGWVAVGLAGDPAVWTSSDGSTWTRSPETFGATLTDPFVGVRDVVAGGLGFVAVGCAPCQPKGAIAAAWTSADGLRWTRAAVAGSGTFGAGSGTGSPDGAEMRAVAASPDGRIVAVGAAFATFDHSVGMAWVSSDGRRWARSGSGVPIGACDETGCPGFSDVAAGAAGLVAVGGVARIVGNLVRCDRTASWWSRDGAAWRSVGDAVGMVGGDSPASLDRVAAGPSGYLAAGLGPLGDGNIAAFAWTSPPGPEASIVPSPAPGASPSDPCSS